MHEEKKDKQDIMIEILSEMLKWIKVTSIPKVKKLLLDVLPSDKEKIAYHYSDGRDSREVAKVAGVHFTTVARWWKTWTRVGIAESLSAKGGERAKRIFSLEDFGIEATQLEVKTEKKELVAPTESAKPSVEKPAQEATKEGTANE